MIVRVVGALVNCESQSMGEDDVLTETFALFARIKSRRLCLKMRSFPVAVRSLADHDVHFGVDYK